MEIKDWIEKVKAIKVSELIASVKEWDRQTWIYVGAGTIVGILFLNFLFYPAWCQRPALKKQSVEGEAQILRLKALNDKKPKLAAQKKEIQKLMDDFQKKLFTREEVNFVLGKISKVAEDAEVELISSKPFEDKDVFPAPYSEKYKKFVYQISVEGSFHRIASFVSYLESSSQYFQIQSLGIVPQTGADKMGKLVADIKLMAVSHNMPIPPKVDTYDAAK